MEDYNKKAEEFCKGYGVTVTFKLSPAQDAPKWAKNEPRGLKYNVTIRRYALGKEFKFPFWDSIHNKENGIKPTAYDVLACLTKHKPESLADFFSEYGYEPTLENADLYKAVVKEAHDVQAMFWDCLDELSEIS